MQKKMFQRQWVGAIERHHFIFYSFHATLLGSRENFVSVPKPGRKYNPFSEFVNAEQ